MSKASQTTTTSDLPPVGSLVRVYGCLTLAHQEVMERVNELRMDDRFYVGDDIVQWKDADGCEWTVRKASREKGAVDFVVRSKHPGLERVTSPRAVRGGLEFTSTCAFKVTKHVDDGTFEVVGKKKASDPVAVTCHLSLSDRSHPSAGWVPLVKKGKSSSSRAVIEAAMEEVGETTDKPNAATEADDEAATATTDAATIAVPPPIMFVPYVCPLAADVVISPGSYVIYPSAVDKYVYAKVDTVNGLIASLDYQDIKLPVKLLTAVLYRVEGTPLLLVVQDCLAKTDPLPLSALSDEVCLRLLQLAEKDSMCLCIDECLKDVLVQQLLALMPLSEQAAWTRYGGGRKRPAALHGGEDIDSSDADEKQDEGDVAGEASSKRQKRLAPRAVTPYFCSPIFYPFKPTVNQRVVFPVHDGEVSYDVATVVDVQHAPNSGTSFLVTLETDEEVVTDVLSSCLTPVEMVILVSLDESSPSIEEVFADEQTLLPHVKVHFYDFAPKWYVDLDQASLQRLRDLLLDQDKPLLSEVRVMASGLDMNTATSLSLRAREAVLAHADAMKASSEKEQKGKTEEEDADEDVELHRLLDAKLAAIESRNAKIAEYDAALATREKQLVENVTEQEKKVEELRAHLDAKQVALSALRASLEDVRCERANVGSCGSEEPGRRAFEDKVRSIVAALSQSGA